LAGSRIDELVVESLKGVSDVLISTDIQHALEALHDNIAVMRHPDHSGGESNELQATDGQGS
jgi:phospholipase D1/2